MLVKVTHRIALGFALLVLFIMVVGGGGLWGTEQINRKLHEITDSSLPTALGSFNQMIALQQAQIALLNVLADDQLDDKERKVEQARFQQQLSTFTGQLDALQPLAQQHPELAASLQQSGTSQEAFAAAAERVMALHEERIKVQQRVLQKESRFQRQTSSLATWSQQYLSRPGDNDGPVHARALMRTLNSHRDQLMLFQQKGDFPALQRSLQEADGQLTKTLQTFAEVDPKANRIKVLIRDINQHLYGKDGLVALYQQSWQAGNALQSQLDETRNKLAQARQAAETFIATARQLTDNSRSQADRTAGISQTLIGLLLAGATLLALLISVITVRTISRPLNEMLGKLSQVAQGDMRQTFDEQRNDEFGMLGHALNEVVDKLSGLLRQIADGAGHLTEVAERNAVVSRQTTSAMGEQSRQLELTASAATEMASTVSEVHGHAQTTQQAVQHCERLSVDVDNHVQRTLGAIEQQAGDISAAMQHSDQLEQYSRQIGTILDTIGEIAEQTNLLALNAAIEAARAGDHGRGFAVVADEVRGLASRTQNSTQEIQQMVENMQNSIQQVVGVMQQSAQQTQQCVEHASTSQQALSEMNRVIAEIHRMSTQIAEAANQQNLAVEEVSRALEQINQAAGETAHGAENVSASSGGLLDIAQQQRELIARFQV
ncbi:HAMP domain-containing methyl-accepting chemotaxis protein [Marinobacterium arenosum]|uniref:HAMP domain-containing methyl-accepting chemotaxis protein n=1 Tax=Marinobacterium arenosum TaxID=2862496 RepID=UPI001C973707|nr:methyl-accepting chemotaxis protein [Marinobacterium arenosum]MBY4676232.1 methyl-accepting chemotaxis protein [Marinobacterium arenosum]